MPQFKKGDRVVYKYSGHGAGHPMHDGAFGTVTSVDPGAHEVMVRVNVEWDDPHRAFGIAPWDKNLQHLLAPVVAIDTPTTAYEVDSHHDDIAHPSHYTDGRKYEPKDVIRDWGLAFNLGAVVKYVARAGRKADTPTLKDLRKARQFLDFEIEALEAEAAK